MGDEALQEIIPHMVKARTFAEYVKHIEASSGINVSDRILDRAIDNRIVNFYDIMAS